MSKIKLKKNNTTIKERLDKLEDENIKTLSEQNVISLPNDEATNKLELLKYTSQVQSRIREDITSDFTLAKFNEKDKEFIIEHTVTAYYTKKVILMQLKKTQYLWNNDKKQWIEIYLNQNDKDKIRTIAKAVFDTFMNRIYMIAITNRNVDSNHLLRYLSGIGDDGQILEDPEEKKVSTKLKKLIQPEDKNEEE